MKKILTILAAGGLAASSAFGQLVVGSLDTPAVIGFNAGPGGVISGVWGPTSTPTGSQFAPTPSNLAPFDSDAWAARVGATGNYTLPADGSATTASVGFGGTTAAGAVNRGVNATAGFTAGLGLATALGNTTGNNGLAFNPSGTGTDNATVWLKIHNTTGQTVDSWTFSYTGYYTPRLLVFGK